MQDGNLRSFGMMLDGRLPTTSIRRCGEDTTLLIVLNAHDDNCPVHPPGDGGRKAVDKASAAELGKGMPGPALRSSAVKTIGAALDCPSANVISDTQIRYVWNFGPLFKPLGEFI